MLTFISSLKKPKYIVFVGYFTKLYFEWTKNVQGGGRNPFQISQNDDVFHCFDFFLTLFQT